MVTACLLGFTLGAFVSSHSVDHPRHKWPLVVVGSIVVVLLGILFDKIGLP